MVLVVLLDKVFSFQKSLSFFVRLLAVAALVLTSSFALATHSLAVSSTTPIVTLGDGADATSTTLGPGYSATNTDSFTLRTSTTTSVVTNVLVNLSAGAKNDGITWATSTGAASTTVNNPWTSVTYGNGLFVAVSATTTNQNVMTSPDGVTWTLRTGTTTNAWQSVTFGNGLFVAVANSGVSYRVMTSPDGITWTSRASTTPFNNPWTSVTYGNGLFVAVAASSTTNNVMTSPDGVTWTSRVGATSNLWNSVTYANGLFVAVASTGTNSNRVMTSPDGITWTSRTSATGNRWTSVTYGNGLYVAASASSSASGIMTSPDGFTWAMRTGVAFNASTTIIFTGGVFVAVAATSSLNSVMTSSDGITWTARTASSANTWKSVVSGNGTLVAVSNSGTGNRAMISTSGTDASTALGKNNGVTWATTTSPSGNVWNSITYGNGLFVAVGWWGSGYAGGTGVMTSPDGITWTGRNSTSNIFWNSVTYGNGLFVAVAQDGTGNRVMTSQDGITWTSRSSAADNTWYSITYGAGLFVAVSQDGNNNRVMTSPDGVTWASRTSAANNSWNSVTYGNGTFVAVSASSTVNNVMTSPDGVTWTLRAGASLNSWMAVTFGNGLFVAVSNDGIGDNVMTSPNGITWTSRTSAADDGWFSIAYGNGVFVSVSLAGSAVMVSPDGINWATSTTASVQTWSSIAYGNGRFAVVSVYGGSEGIMTSNSGTYYNNTEVYKGVSLVEVTNDAGSTVYGSVASPSADTLSIPLTTNVLTVSTTTTQYRIRVTPKSHDLMPDPSFGDNHAIRAKVTSIVSSTGVVEGEDAATTTATIDNKVTGMTSTGLSWVSLDTNQSHQSRSLTYGNGLFVSVSDNGGGLISSNDGVIWRSNANFPGNSEWRSITYGNGLFVAISIYCAGSDCIMTSPDGVTWTSRTSAASNQWTSVTYGNGLFVAVSIDGTGNRVMTSPDGIIWTSRTSASDSGWFSVTYGNGLFVAVGSVGSVMTSPDGITWTSRTAISRVWQSVIYGNGLFVAVACGVSYCGDLGSVDTVMTSVDGITWTSRTSAADNQWFSVTYGNGLFVAVSSFVNDTDIMTSPDGITWTAHTGGVDKYWASVTYGNGLFVAGGLYSAVTSSAFTQSASNNKVTLTFTTPSDSDLSSILVLQNTSTTSLTLPQDGVTYATSSKVGTSDVACAFGVATSTTYTCNATYNTFNGIPYFFKLFTRDTRGNYSEGILTASSTPGRAITLGTGVDTASTTLSPDGTATTSDTFSLQTDQGTDVITSVVVTFASGTATSTSLIEITNNSGTVVYGSVTTTTSDTVTIPLSSNTLTATSGPTQYKIRITPKSHVNMPGTSIGASYALTSYISDWTGTNIINKSGSDTASTTITIDNLSPENVDEFGVKRRIRFGLAANEWNSIAYGSNTFVAVSGSGTIADKVMTSPDGVTWTSRTAAANNAWNSVTYGNGLFVAVSYDGSGDRVMTSPDGITWTIGASAADNSWNSVVYGNGLFVAVSGDGAGNRVMTSSNGTAWTSRTSAEDNVWTSITFGNGLFVVVACGVNQSGICNADSGNRVMTSSDGITWTSRTSAADNNWNSVTYGNGLFVAVAQSAGTGQAVMTSSDGINWVLQSNAASLSWYGVTYGGGLFMAVDQSGNVMTSPDGVAWTIRAQSPNTNWKSVAYGTSTFVIVGYDYGSGYYINTSSGPSLTSTSSQITVTSYSPSITDLSKILVLRSTSPFSSATTPVEGVTYATSSTIDTATAVCSTTIAASTTHTCVDTGLSNGWIYYYKIFTQDSSGNWSTGVEPIGSPTSPGDTTITLGSGSDPVGGALAPDGSATTSDTFTFQTDSGFDTVQSVTVTTATSTAVSLSLIEITNDAGNTVYGSVANPTSDVNTITLSMNSLLATPSLTQYRIRVTPKSHTNMPSVPGTTYYVTSRISSWVGTFTRQAGSDVGATTTVLTIDNTSPVNVDELGVKWRSRVYPIDNNWSSVAYGTSTFVAVSLNGSGDRVMTSPDGVTWTSRTSAADNSWRSVAYGNGLFVAVACGSYCFNPGGINSVMTSPDGIIWTSRTSAADNNWQSVAYGKGIFVAVSTTGVGNRVMTSSDGITWTSRTSAADSEWREVTYGNGLFVAVASSGVNDRVMTSSDGITWTLRAGSTIDSWVSVTYGNGIFVALAYNAVMTSLDGITWTTRTSPTDNAWQSVTYGNGLFVAVAQTGASNRVMTSPDGITWTVRSSVADNSWNSVTYGNGTFVTVSWDGTNNKIMTSSGPTLTATNTQITVTSYTPSITDLSKIVVFRSFSAINTSPIEGMSYATSSTLGSATAVCSTTIAASSTHTCVDTGLSNGSQYYYKIYTQDTRGNWSTGVEPIGSPISPGNKTVTLSTGTDTPSLAISPGASATTSDTFTFKTDTGTDVIFTADVAFASGTAQALSLVEITNDAGSTVYGSTADPSSDVFTVTLSTNTLTANTSQTQYRIRVTPKTHANMPAVPGSTYYLTSRITSWLGTAGIMAGSDLGATTTILTIDNASPSDVSSATGAVNASKQSVLSFTNPSTVDATSTVTLRSLSSVIDVPVEGATYSAGNTIGAATVVCVNPNIVLSSAATCTDTTVVRGKNYYYKIFVKDNAGNYSAGIVPSGMPLKVTTEAAGIYIEGEIQSGGTVNVTGGGNSSGGGTGNGSTTNGTTTQTGGGQGGGGGDSGFEYHGSNIASVFQKAFGYFFGGMFTGGAQAANADTAKPAVQDAVPSSSASIVSTCSLKVFGICLISNVPGMTK